MTTFEQAKEARKEAATMPVFAHGSVNGIGLAKQGNGFAVAVAFVGEKPDTELPEQILGVPVVYLFNVGRKAAL